MKEEKVFECGEEGVKTMFNEHGELIAISRRDEKSKKHLVYIVKEATSEDIIKMMGGKKLSTPS